MKKRKSKKIIFTIVELLFVISIVVILMAILLPTLRTAKKKVQGSVCGSNIKQIFNASLMYANDNSNYLPTTEVSGSNIWFCKLVFNEYVPAWGAYTSIGNVYLGGPKQGVQNTPFWCPLTILYGDEASHVNTSFAMNDNLNYLKRPRIDSIVAPSEEVVFLDGRLS